MMGSTTVPSTGLPANSSRAIGTPEASVFLLPQKTATISSSTAKPRRRASQRVKASIGNRNNAAPASTRASRPRPWRAHRPSATASLNEHQTSIRITPRSTHWVTGLMRLNHSPTKRRATWPSTKGSSSMRATLSMVSPSGMAPPSTPVWNIRLASNGVSTTPSRVDRLALSTAAATSPLASAVIATEDETVEGSTAR